LLASANSNNNFNNKNTQTEQSQEKMQYHKLATSQGVCARCINPTVGLPTISTKIGGHQS